MTKKRCWGCSSLHVIRWGKRASTQRFKCKDCGLLFSGENKAVKLSNQFSWFNQWILHRSTLEELSARSGYSKRKLQYLFDQYLSKPPQWFIHQKINLYLIIRVR